MTTKKNIPKGYRLLRANEAIRGGDFYDYFNLADIAEWAPMGTFGAIRIGGPTLGELRKTRPDFAGRVCRKITKKKTSKTCRHAR